MGDRGEPGAPWGMARGFAEGLRERLEARAPGGPILMPSPGPYRSVFAWDSGWHYYWLEALDPERAAAEIETLMACAEADGRVPHETPIPGGPPYRGLRKLQLALLRESFDPTGASWLVDPPIYLVAAADAAKAAEVTRPAAASSLGEAARRSLAWIEGNRRAAFLAPPYDRLPAILHPLESGTDFSPALDAVWGRPPALQLRSLSSLRSLSRMGWSLAGASTAEVPLVFDPCFIALYLGARRRLAPGAETEALVEAYWEACFDGSAGAFRQAAALPGRPASRRGRVTFSGMLPFLLYPRGPRREAAREAIARNALPGGAFWELELPSFNAGVRRPSRWLWRGAQSWMNMNFCHWSMLRLYGFGAEAGLLLDRITRRLEGGGAWEWLDPRGGPGAPRGGGALPFSWNGLLLAMAEGRVLEF